MAPTVTEGAREILGMREDERTELEEVVDPKGGRFLGAVVAFLNTKGGTVYFGVAETDGVATGLPGLADPGIDSSRILDSVADLIEPRPSLPALRRLELPSGRAILALDVPQSPEGPHALRQRAGYAVYERIGDRNKPLSFTEIERLIRRGQEHGRPDRSGHRDLADRVSPVVDAMRDARSRFLQESGARTLRVACWPAPELDGPVDLDDAELRALLRDGSPIGVRSSGWNYLSTWTELGREQGALTVGRSEPSVYRHLRIEETGRVELTTDEDELWSWHQASLAGQVVDPFVLTEYPASVLRLAAWLLKRAPRPPDRVLVELVVRNGADLHLFPGHPGSITFGSRGIASRLRSDGPDLCVAPTGPLEIDGRDFLENPDRAAHRLARAAYQAFGIEEADMPFFDARQGRFSFPG